MTLIKPSLFQLIVGVSLTGITAGLLYILLGKDEDDVEEFVQRIKTSRSATIEVKIPKECVGVVIGRAGANIKEIQDKSETKINFKDDQAEENYRVCIIRGSPEAAQLAESLIHEFISNQPLIEVASMLVPQLACGRIIGKSGENIRSISRASSAKITVEPSGTNGNTSGTGPYRRVLIKGTGDQIEIAKALIQEKVDEDAEVRRKQECNSKPTRGRENIQYLMSSETQIKPDPNIIRGREFLKRNNLKCLRLFKGSNHCGLKKGNSDATLLQVFKRKILQDDAEVSEKLAAVSCDGTIEVYVCAVSSPSTFWVQLCGPRAVELDFLVERMTDYYNKPENQEVHEIKPPLQVNQMVVAPYMMDQKWYRAKVVRIVENEYNSSESEIEVFYVDYGDSQTLKLNDLYRLRTDFLQLRFQAIECSLAGVVPKDGDTWSSEAIDTFEELAHYAQWVKITARVQSYQPGKGFGSINSGVQVPCIELFDTSVPEAPSVAEELVKQGYADWKRSTTEQKNASRSPEVSASPSPYGSRLSMASDKVGGDSLSNSAPLSLSLYGKENKCLVKSPVTVSTNEVNDSLNPRDKKEDVGETGRTSLRNDLCLSSVDNKNDNLSKEGRLNPAVSGTKYSLTPLRRPTGAGPSIPVPEGFLPAEALSDEDDDEDGFDAP